MLQDRSLCNHHGHNPALIHYTTSVRNFNQQKPKASTALIHQQYAAASPSSSHPEYPHEPLALPVAALGPLDPAQNPLNLIHALVATAANDASLLAQFARWSSYRAVPSSDRVDGLRAKDSS